ncbi:precorrin-6Y C5,15-methyltransferase (decarboxylating) subunit CbiT [Mitsuokella sp.]|uniref:precorrin-6Y C5,15-methyltransferase (decarboxylating) subunit CbiT n=1 Tax=Mitsuokella sp. TaxID=2049034 RepID=UPI0029E33423|nr:precorrin-6Y C5,15-methyltransferase (decarboxylating) subunit CbiT [Mitsuokella sp.]MDD6383691.1 precorrin-6Y C5,15-methyltransferase (decarboxylating) subunit CbiT [Selenomonadaceae bacterium]MDY4473780.1 precorrin-6Y C5,15-methyltransferase (decarboxylating) subunit CbiT [Mitsuokella sp.]
MEFGMDDAAFIRGNVPMTKQEIRILTLVKAHIHPQDVVYDIGAGTGSLSVEAAGLAREGRVYALERNAEAVALIEANKKQFGLDNVEALHREAPDGLEELPAPDVVLIGGSGKHLNAILETVTEKLVPGGRVVLNCITLQTVMTAISFLRRHEDIYTYDAIQVQVSRLQRVGPYDMAKAMNPIYIITCVKGGTK